MNPAGNAPGFLSSLRHSAKASPTSSGVTHRVSTPNRTSSDTPIHGCIPHNYYPPSHQHSRTTCATQATALRCSFVPHPPRERPSAWSAGARHEVTAAGAGSVLVRPHDRGVDREIPDDQPAGVRPRLKRGHQPRPETGELAPTEEGIHALPRTVAFGHVAPGR